MSVVLSPSVLWDSIPIAKNNKTKNQEKLLSENILFLHALVFTGKVKVSNHVGHYKK
jgi:hypothetical protein